MDINDTRSTLETIDTGIIPDGMNTYKSHSILNPDGIKVVKIIPIFKSGDAFN